MADAARHKLDRIYGLPLEEFTAVRNEAAKRLKADGDAEAAAVVKSAAAAEQREIDSLLRAARKVGGGTGGPTIDRVAETLQAAAGDPDLAETIRAGLLERERRAERRVASAERSLERARGLAEAAEEALEARRAKVEKAEGELEAAEAARAELDEAG